MSQQTPVTGASAVVKKGSTAIGYCTGVSVEISVDLIKEYYIGSSNPVTIAGTKSYTVSIEKMFLDNSYGQDVLNGSKVTIDVFPMGETTGKPKISLSNVTLTRWSLSIEPDGIIMESVEGEAESLTFGTVTS